MGTNYYRIPLAEEVEKKRKILVVQIETMDLNPSDIEGGFRFISPRKDWEWFNPWDMFMEDISVHLGKRSMGWKFCWNFHKDKYFTNKEELLAFIKSGRVVDEYGTEWNVDEFIEMAMEWGQPDGLVADENYMRSREHYLGNNWKAYADREIDGLRVSSSTEFC